MFLKVVYIFNINTIFRFYTIIHKRIVNKLETIEELRKICQRTRVTVWSDFLSNFYHYVAIYFTKVFLYLNMSGNQVTVLSGLVSIAGGAMICFDNKIITVIGFLFFHLFAIFDYCDGEVARYNKTGGIEGHCLDWFMHFVTSSALMMGLFIFSFNYLQNNLLIIIALIAILTPVFDKIITCAGWTVIAWTKFRRFENKDPINLNLETENTSLPKQKNILLQYFKLLVIHLLTEHWVKFTFLIFALIDLVLFIVNIPFFNYKFYILIYIGLMGPLYIFLRIFKLLRSHSLIKGYNRLFHSNKKPVFPDTDFL